ncbi:MAG: hypothetical protein AAB365_03860 [Patescibacteria group bacterium]
MKKEYTITPSFISRNDIQAALFEGDVLHLNTQEGPQLILRVASVKTLKDKELNAYLMRGLFFEEGSAPTRALECVLLFKERDGSGTLTIIEPEKGTVDQLVRLSDEKLREMITLDRKLSLSLMESFQRRLQKMPRHEALVLEARATGKVAQVTMHAELDYDAYMLMNGGTLKTPAHA